MLIGSTRAKFPSYVTISHVVQDEEPKNNIGAKLNCANLAYRTFPSEPLFVIDRSRPRGGRG